MPANSYLGSRAIVVRVNAIAFYPYTRADTFADVVRIPGGGTTLQLPDEPSDGDYYAWNNADGSCAAGSPLTVTLSAAAIAAGVTIQGATSVTYTAPDAAGFVVWFDEEDAWVLFLSASSSSSSGLGGEIVWRPGGVAVSGRRRDGRAGQGGDRRVARSADRLCG